MAKEDRAARNTTTGPAVPGQRQHASDQADTGQRDTGQRDTGQHQGDEEPSPAQASAQHVLERTRLGGTWVAIGCFAVVLVFLLVFIVQNDTHVSVNFFGTHSDVHLGVALVLAAICGALLVTFAGMARIMQLRSRARKHQRTINKAASH